MVDIKADLERIGDAINKNKKKDYPGNQQEFDQAVEAGDKKKASAYVESVKAVAKLDTTLRASVRARDQVLQARKKEAIAQKLKVRRKSKISGSKGGKSRAKRATTEANERYRDWLRLRKEILSEEGADKTYQGKKWKWNLAREVLKRAIHEDQEYVSDADLEAALTDDKIKYCRDKMSKLLKQSVTK